MCESSAQLFSSLNENEFLLKNIELSLIFLEINQHLISAFSRLIKK
jgi:hypothetical protein